MQGDSDASPGMVWQYYCTECPQKELCSHNSWTHANVKSVVSWEDCYDKLRAHLKNSSKHWHNSPEVTDELVANANIEVVEAPIKTEEEELQPPPPKRGKGNAKGSKGAPSTDQIQQIVASTVTETLNAVRQSRGSASASSDGDPSTGAIQLFHKNQGHDIKMVVSRNQYMTAMESMKRTKRAAKSALGFFQAGVSAFTEELKTIDECLDTMEEVESSMSVWRS